MILQGNIQYNLIGDIPGSSYFRVNSTTGMVFVAVNLRQDSTQFYQVIFVYCIKIICLL